MYAAITIQRIGRVLKSLDGLIFAQSFKLSRRALLALNSAKLKPPKKKKEFYADTVVTSFRQIPDLSNHRNGLGGPHSVRSDRDLFWPQ